MRIRTRFMLAFGGLFLVVVITAGLMLYTLVTTRNSYEEFVEGAHRRAELAEEIRYYDVLLTDTVRAYLIQPQSRSIYNSYFEYADALDAALAEARALAASEEEVQILANIDATNTELIAIEESLLENPIISRALPIYNGEYANLKAEFSAHVGRLTELAHEAEERTNEQVFSQINRGVVVMVALAVILLLSLPIVAVLIRSVLRPLGALNAATKEISRGNFDAPMPPRTSDEIGDLRDSFASMVDDIRRTLEYLQARSRDLQAVADVNDQISTVLDLNRLLQDVADLTKERFGLYHAHIYAYDAAQERLVLTSGAGHVGRQMVAEERIIPLKTRESIVAQAARTHQTVIIGDVHSSETFLPHPLLPNTRSELATVLVARGELLGVLDVQSDKVEFFNSEVAEVLELMAGQIASAISNARLYTAAERASRFEQAIGRLDRHLQAAVDIDDILQTTVRELGKALRVSNTTIELSLDGWSASGNGNQPSKVRQD